jgi:hypothetical protein
VTSIAINPGNLSGANDVNKLVITGQIKVPPGEDRMRGVVRLVGSMQGDSTFPAVY